MEMGAGGGGSCTTDLNSPVTTDLPAKDKQRLTSEAVTYIESLFVPGRVGVSFVIDAAVHTTCYPELSLTDYQPTQAHRRMLHSLWQP